jgi:hypothetical protein
MNMIRTLTERINHAAFLSTRTNPVLLRCVDHPTLTSALVDYCALPRRIVTLLADGLWAVAGWQAVETDIRENIGDETGRRTGGVPHYQILARGLERELGLDIQAAIPTEETESFIVAIRNGLLTETRPYAAGILWALEATAVPELAVVATAINRASQFADGPALIDLKAPGSDPVLNWKELSLSRFFSLHIGEFEIDHRDGLRDAVLGYLNTDGEEQEFESGAKFVLDRMGQWWRQLAH